MPTNAQIEADRRNALKSTGPRTPAGKAQSARNALHHGLASISAHAFLAVEDQAAFERLLHRYVLKYQPAHADEVDLLTDAVFRKWRQQGLWTIEAQAIEIDIAALQHDLPKANAPAHLAHAVHHSLDHSLKELQALQATRVGDEPTLPLLNPKFPYRTNPIPRPPDMSNLTQNHNRTTPLQLTRQLLDFTPGETQSALLTTPAPYVLLNCHRQWGKTTLTAVRALHQALPRQNILIVSPTPRQSRLLTSLCQSFARKLQLSFTTDGANPCSVRLPNGSLILALPAHPAHARGFNAHLLIVDEAARFSDEVFSAITPLIAATSGSSPRPTANAASSIAN